MYAIILAAGEGTRLRPYTDDKPKSMVEVDGKPILEYQIEQLVDAGFTDVVIVELYKSEVIKDYFEDGSRFGIAIHHLDQETGDIGSLGAVKKALNQIPKNEEDVVILYGDIISDVSLAALMARHREIRLPMTLWVRDYTVPYGVASVNGEGIINRFTEKPVILINTAVGVVRREIVDDLPDRGDFFGDATKRYEGNMASFIYEGLWLHITDGNDLHLAEEILREQRINREGQNNRGPERL